MPPLASSSSLRLGRAGASSCVLARGADAPAPDGATAGPDLPVAAFLAHVAGLLTQLGERIDAAHFSHQLPQRAVAPSQPFASIAHPRER